MHRSHRWLAALMSGALVLASTAHAQRPRPTVIDLWTSGRPAFGVFVPNENPGRRGRGANPLYDYLFLNLEGGYDVAHVRAIADGLRRAGALGRTALLVRIPPLSRDGAQATAARIKEIFAAGADGVTLPHIRNVDEARQAIGFFAAAGANVWSPGNPDGNRLAMLMLEDPDAVAQAAAIADLPGYSILACGIGSLRGALGGDREAAEAGVQAVLAESKRAKLVNMLTANAEDVAQRVQEGFLALLMRGPGADDAIRRMRGTGEFSTETGPAVPGVGAMPPDPWHR